MKKATRYYYENDKILFSETTNTIRKNYKYIEDVNVYDLKKIKVVEGKIVNKTEEEIKKDKENQYNSLNYKAKRSSNYPYLEEQVDAIYKGFEAIKDTITLPQETLDWIDKCKKVKEDIPKT